MRPIRSLFPAIADRSSVVKAHRRVGLAGAVVVLLLAAGSLPLDAQRNLRSLKPAGSVVAEPGAPETPSSTDPADDDTVGLIVRLRAESLTARMRGRDGRGRGKRGIDFTSPEVRNQQNEIASQQSGFERSLRSVAPRARVGRRMQVALNAVSIVVPRRQMAAIGRLANVDAVYPDSRRQVQTTRTPALIGAAALTSGQNGQSASGNGVVIGLIDTGLWPEHPSFADPAPSGSYQTPAGWHGAPCEFGSSAPGDLPYVCTNKILGARRMMATYDQLVATPGEFLSARDEIGHGTFVGSVAAGNAGVPAAISGNPLGAAAGVAPRAQLAIYKVCGRAGCYDSDAIAAVEQAVIDGVDIIHLPLSGGADPYDDPLSLALLDAHNAGVFVVTAAGNSGVGDVAGRHEPWTTTVGATTVDRMFASVLTVRSGSKSTAVYGASITPGIATAAPLVLASSVGDTYCTASSPATTFTGKIVVCARGGNSRVEKSFNVRQRGAIGMIMTNPTEAPTYADNHFLPTVHLGKAASDTLATFLASNPSSTATFTAGAGYAVSGGADIMGSFTSRGGAGQPLGITKPDLVAPGVQVLGGHTAAPYLREGGPTGESFQVMEGTSVASAHVAGAAALLAELHPEWTPDHIKSALMLTATSVVKKESGAAGDVFDFGAGRIRVDQAAQPGLAITSTPGDFLAKKATLWDVNYPALYIPRMAGIVGTTRTLENLENKTAVWNIYTQASTGMKITVPTSITLPPLGTATLTIVLDGTALRIDDLGAGALYFVESGGTRMLRMPIALLRKPNAIPMSTTCTSGSIKVGTSTDCALDVANLDTAPAAMTVFDSLPTALRVVPGSVSGGVQSGNAVVGQMTLAPAVPGGIDLRMFPPYEGWLSLSSYYAPIACTGSCDDRVFTTDVPAGIAYNGAVFHSLTISSNGFVLLGNTGDSTPVNQPFPSAAAPNNVLAPFWTDLQPAGTDGTGSGRMYAGYLSFASGRTWLVVEWAGVVTKGTTAKHTFQVWMQVGGQVEDITYSYQTLESLGAGGALTVGAEDALGAHGDAYYYNGSGTPPIAGSNITVSSVAPSAGGSARITFRVTGQSTGTFTHCGAAVRDGSGEVAVSCLPVTVRP